MLVELQVTNFAIIKHLQIPFYTGFNVLSGETGAGKSVILKSLALLMGEKAMADTVRSNTDQAVIVGAFDISSRQDIKSKMSDMGIPVDEATLIVKRVISPVGKSKVYINGSLSALSNLREIVSPLITVTGHLAPLIEITGQHDNRHLQSKAYHLDVIDQFANVLGERESFVNEFGHLKTMKHEFAEIQQHSMEREQRLDFLRFQENEIESLGLRMGEDKELEARYKTLSNASRLGEFSSQLEQSLYADDDSALTRIERILQRATDLEKYSPGLSDKLLPLKEAKALIDEVVHDLRDFSEELDADPKELDEIESRLTQLKRLQKKHGSSVEEILENLEKIKLDISSIEGDDDRLEELQKEIAQKHLKLKASSEMLHDARLKGARDLAKKVNSELKDLNMKGVELVIQVQRSEMTSTGSSDVEFLISNGKKDSVRSLSKFASGGELSRILLSVKKVIGNNELPRTYLFDEVDAGVSGPTAEKVGRKLKTISKGQQVICVTHLPQVAAFANHHFLIEKQNNKSEVSMSVLELNKKDQINEIARLISGEKISKTSLDHAKQLLNDSL